MSGIIKHLKDYDPATFPDSGETGKLQPSDMSAPHKLIGGSDGQPLCRDTSDATYGSKFTAFPNMDGFVVSGSTPGAPPDKTVWVEITGDATASRFILKYQIGGVTRVAIDISYP